MLNFLTAAIHNSMIILTASVIGVLPPIFQFQNDALYETPVLNQVSTEIFQNKFLPEVHLSTDEKPAVTSTKASIKEIGGSVIKLSLPDVKLKFPPLPAPKIAQPAAEPKKVEKTETSQVKSPAIASAPLKILTPQDVLNTTSFSLNQRIDGQYIASLHTKIGTGSAIDWGFYSDTIGGTASIPKMNATYSCDPQWNPAPYNSSDQNPTFDMATSYNCDISLTDSLLRTATKRISFQTGAGRLFVNSSNLSTQLKSGSNENGFVFDNQSDSKITINSLTFDVYFKALNVSSPIIMRFVNPDNSASYLDFPVQNIPVSAADSGARTAAGMQASFSFSINPRSQRLLTVQLFGIQQLMTVGINPEFKVILRQINTDNPNLKTVLFSPTISWVCIPFDPTTSVTSIPTEQNCR